jgi:hypothetical protein
MLSMASSAPWNMSRPMMLNYEAEIEYFHFHLSGERAWV